MFATFDRNKRTCTALITERVHNDPFTCVRRKLSEFHVACFLPYLGQRDRSAPLRDAECRKAETSLSIVFAQDYNA